MQKSNESVLTRWARPSVFAAAVLIAALFAYGQSNPDFLYLLSNALPPFMALAALAIAGVALNRNGVRRGDRLGWIWLGYTLGMLLWFLGESTWAVYSLLLGVPIPFPSVADAFWLAGYLPFLGALLQQTLPFRAAFSSRTLAVGVVFTLALAVVVLAALIPPIFADEQETVTLAVSLAYPFLDILLLSVALPAFLLFRTGTFWKPLLFVILGILLTLVGDLLFSWTTLYGTYYNGHPLELFFHWSYLAFALGFYVRLIEAKTTGKAREAA